MNWRENRRFVVAGIGVIGMAALGTLVALHPGTGLAKRVAARSTQKPGEIEHMELQKQYYGPLKDTLIQRWRDPDNGAICYVYLPVIVQHSPPTQSGLVQYGANGIGSISCLPKR